jgi:hypothetical protein
MRWAQRLLWRLLLLLLITYVSVQFLQHVSASFTPSYRYAPPQTDAVKTSAAWHDVQQSPTERLLFFYWLGE